MDAHGKVDLVTFEVLRHRLWEINDEMGLLAGRISGSPAVYESGDFNTAILTPDGKGLFAGVYVIRQASALDVVVQEVLRLFDGDIRDGDVFLTNDPWAGALHAMDAAVVAPVFWRDELVAWTGIVMHELDVGGPRPGSWSVGARDAYQEAPILPPVKLVAGGTLRQDVEAAFLRNSRTSKVNALNLRAKVASQVSTRERLHEIINEYGRDTFVAIQSQILDYVRTTVRNRIASLPDGIFHANGYLDHDGVTPAVYRLRLSLTKSGDRLIFDFSGTDRQAPGPINCAYSGLVGGILQVLFPLLCFDVPWSHGAVWDCIDVVSEPGTLNNALFPAATSMATVNACQATGDLVWEAMGRLYGSSSDLREEVMALGYGGVNMGVLAGNRADGSGFVNLFTDSVGGGGARSFRDGVDTSGNFLAPAYAIPNVERIESLAPVLYIYRKQRQDTAGAGIYRGGAGLEFMVTPHGVDEDLEGVFFSSGCSHPLNKGIFGGAPGTAQRNLILRRSDVRDRLKAGTATGSWEATSYASCEVLQAKDVVTVSPGDAWVNFCSGGGGYGDPLLRDPERVATDVADGIYSREHAARHFGAVFDDEGTVDSERSVERRESIRLDRLKNAQNPRRPSVKGVQTHARRVHDVGPSIAVVEDDTGQRYVCSHCEHGLGAIADDIRLGMSILEQRVSESVPMNRFTDGDSFVLRTYCCPSCGTALSADVELLAEEEPLPELTLRMSESGGGGYEG